MKDNFFTRVTEFLDLDKTLTNQIRSLERHYKTYKPYVTPEAFERLDYAVNHYYRLLPKEFFNQLRCAPGSSEAAIAMFFNQVNDSLHEQLMPKQASFACTMVGYENAALSTMVSAAKGANPRLVELSNAIISPVQTITRIPMVLRAMISELPPHLTYLITPARDCLKTGEKLAGKCNKLQKELDVARLEPGNDHKPLDVLLQELIDNNIKQKACNAASTLANYFDDKQPSSAGHVTLRQWVDTRLLPRIYQLPRQYFNNNTLYLTVLLNELMKRLIDPTAWDELRRCIEALKNERGLAAIHLRHDLPDYRLQ